jgi:hypothetical protein
MIPLAGSGNPTKLKRAPSAGLPARKERMDACETFEFITRSARFEWSGCLGIL